MKSERLEPIPQYSSLSNGAGQQAKILRFQRVLFALCPTGAYCREDRCQSFYSFELVPSMRVPMEECEAAGAVSELSATHSIIDAPAEGINEREFLERCQSFQPDLIVLGVTFGSFAADLKWAQTLRLMFPGVKIGLRGAPAYVWMSRILEQNSPYDFCLQGDYELCMRSLLLFGLSNAEGVITRETTNSFTRPLAPSLDELPVPDRSSLSLQKYRVRLLNAPQVTVHVQRGCPFPCTYCLVHTVTGKEVRHRSPESIAREIQNLTQSGVRFFYFRAETFTLDRSWALAVARELEERCPGIKWVTTTRVECIDEELASALKRAGCYGLSFGIDVVSKEIGTRVKKLTTLKNARKAIQACNRAGIITLGYFMIGFPWETKQTLGETRDFIRSVCPDLVTFHFAHPYPGTSYSRDIEGQEIVSLKAQAEPALRPLALSYGDLEKFRRQVLFRHYSRFFVLASFTRKFLPVMGSALWWKLFRRGGRAL